MESKAIIYSPANKKIAYPLEKAFEIITVHERRHLKQAEEVLDLSEKNKIT